MIALTAYDDLPYDDFPFPETHPGHLGAVAALFGLRAAPPARCRVLELGCGLGANLLAMAVALPRSEFVGVDASARQIASGQADIEALGLRNLTLHAMDLRDIDARLGPFDYILCHGVYSWVPPEVQAKILWICRALLAPAGVAYLSYNTLPGWHLRGAIRDVLLRETPADAAPAARAAAARQVLDLLGYAPPMDGARSWLHDELRLLLRMSDAYLFHEHLAPENQAVYFRDLARTTAQAGLQYLGDAQLWTMMPDRFGEGAAAAIAERARGLVEREQLFDYLELRFFRRSLLCHREAPLDRTLTWPKLRGLWLRAGLSRESDAAGGAADSGEASFSLGRGLSLSTSSRELGIALAALSDQYPGSLAFDALCERALAEAGAAGDAGALDRLGKNLLGLALRDEIELDAWERPCAPRPGPRPLATALARLEASRGRDGCTTLLHRRVAVDAFDRALLARMDGSRSAEALAAGAAEEIAAGRLTVEVEGEPRSDAEVLREITEQKLARLARAGFVLAG